MKCRPLLVRLHHTASIAMITGTGRGRVVDSGGGVAASGPTRKARDVRFRATGKSIADIGRAAIRGGACRGSPIGICARGWPAAPGGERPAPPADRGDKPLSRAPKSKARPGRLLRTRECHSALNAMPVLVKPCKKNFVYPHYSRPAGSC